MSLKRLLSCITKKTTLTCHWKDYSDVSLKRLSRYVTENATLMYHWKVYYDVSLKMLWWWVTTHWKGYPDMSLKSLFWCVIEKGSMDIPSSQTMGSKELKPWSPRWVRQELRRRNNGLPPNDPNHDEKLLVDVERPLCKWDLDCQSHMSLDHETYVMRYWSCPLPTSPFNWGWDEEKPRKVVLVLTFTLQDFALSSSHH
jgi:hypothetical protein